MNSLHEQTVKNVHPDILKEIFTISILARQVPPTRARCGYATASLQFGPTVDILAADCHRAFLASTLR